MTNKNRSLRAYLSRLAESFGFDSRQKPLVYEDELSRTVARAFKISDLKRKRREWLGKKGSSIGNSFAFGTGVTPLSTPPNCYPFGVATAVFVLTVAATMALHNHPAGWVFFFGGGPLLIFSTYKWLSSVRSVDCAKRSFARTQRRALITITVVLFVSTIATGYVF
jgi:hypothetical protein